MASSLSSENASNGSSVVLSDFSTQSGSVSGILVQRPYAENLRTGRSWDSTAGHDGESMIIRGWRKPVAMSHPFQAGVAKTIHLPGKAVMSARGRLEAPNPRGSVGHNSRLGRALPGAIVPRLLEGDKCLQISQVSMRHRTGAAPRNRDRDRDRVTRHALRFRFRFR